MPPSEACPFTLSGPLALNGTHVLNSKVFILYFDFPNWGDFLPCPQIIFFSHSAGGEMLLKSSVIGGWLECNEGNVVWIDGALGINQAGCDVTLLPADMQMKIKTGQTLKWS